MLYEIVIVGIPILFTIYSINIFNHYYFEKIKELDSKINFAYMHINDIREELNL